MEQIVLGLSRLIHIGAGCFIIGNSFADVMWTEPSSSVSYLISYLVCYVLLLISGVITMVAVRPSQLFEKYDQRIWVAIMYFKFVLWILFIPIPDWIAQSVGGSFPRVQFNGALIFVMLITSVAAKIFREKHAKLDERLL